MNTFTLIKGAQNNTAKAVYVLYALLGILFSGLTLFVVLRTVTQINLTAGLPVLFYVVIALYLVPPAILAYGFLSARKWLISVVAGHLAVTLLTASVLMPLTNQQSAITPTLISSGLYWAFLIFAYATRNYLKGSMINWLVLVPYVLALALSVILRLLITSSF